MKKPYRRRHPVRFGKKIHKAKEESIIKFNKEWLAEREEKRGVGGGKRNGKNQIVYGSVFFSNAHRSAFGGSVYDS